MFELLNKLRQKPESVRRLIAFWTSVAIVFVMVLIWLSALPGQMRELSNSTGNFSAMTPPKQIASPFESMKTALDNLAESFKSNVNYEK
ncbi:MAG TPA: hypothetical protein VJI73_01295 [Candidatus Paceibacterota bacterium]